MNVFLEMALFLQRYLLSARRNPIFLIMGVVSPFLYLLFFTPLLSVLASRGALGTENALSLFVPGMLPIMALTRGLFSGFGMIDEVRTGVLERFRVSPARRLSILLGPVLFDTVTVVVQSTLFILLSLLFGFHVSWIGLPVLFTLLIILSLISSTFGNTMGVILKSEDKFAPLVHGINLPILLLSGTLLPMQLAPKWLLAIAHLNPVYYVVEASRDLALGHIGTASVLYAFLILTPFLVLTLRWAANHYKRAVT